MGPAEYS